MTSGLDVGRRGLGVTPVACFPCAMHLNDRQWGVGDRVALLLHGMTGSSESWHRVGPELQRRGYRAIALDLPGHGHSERDSNLSIPDVSRLVVETLHDLGAERPDVAIGHSFGGTVLAAAIKELKPHRAIYVDAPTSSRGGWDRAETTKEYAASRQSRTNAALRASRPNYSDLDCEVEGRAALDFDPETAAGFAAAEGGDWTPASPPVSLMVRADPSDYVSAEQVAVLESRGVIVRDIPAAAHSVWYSHYDEFMAAIEDWVQVRPLETFTYDVRWPGSEAEPLPGEVHADSGTAVDAGPCRCP